MNIDTLLTAIQEIAPLELAESWDNVGLLVGDRRRKLSGAMTCLTVTQQSLDEAIQGGANLVIAHHPIPFKPVSRITTDSVTGSLLVHALEHGLSIYSPHTAWDNAQGGINDQLAMKLGLIDVQPLVLTEHPKWSPHGVGTGRYGRFPGPTMAASLIDRLAAELPITNPRCTQDTVSISKIGIVCGSGGSMLSQVARRGCDAMLTGEATYHQCLEAQALGIVMILIGHHASEFFAMQTMTSRLKRQFDSLAIWTSTTESSQF